METHLLRTKSWQKSTRGALAALVSLFLAIVVAGFVGATCNWLWTSTGIASLVSTYLKGQQQAPRRIGHMIEQQGHPDSSQDFVPGSKGPEPNRPGPTHFLGARVARLHNIEAETGTPEGLMTGNIEVQAALAQAHHSSLAEPPVERRAQSLLGYEIQHGTSKRSTLNCKVAFVAAVTSPPDGGLSDQTKVFIEAMFLSALSKHYSGCPVVLTNVAGNFDFLQGTINGLQEIVYDGLWGGPETYMYDRIRAYIRFLHEEAASDAPRNLVFSDTDILYIKSLKDIFDKPFDIGLTYRLMPKYPINNGIMFAHSERLQQAALFWESILKIYDDEGYNKKWQGDQYAVCKFMEAAGKYYSGRRNSIKHVSGVDVLLLHVSTFNFPPRSGCRITNEVKVLHFKGDEKSKLPLAWKILRKNSRGSKALDEVAWLNAPKSQKARGNLKNCKDS